MMYSTVLNACQQSFSPFPAPDIRRLQREGAVGHSVSRQDLAHNRQREREVANLNTKPQTNLLYHHPASITRVVFPPRQHARVAPMDERRGAGRTHGRLRRDGSGWALRASGGQVSVAPCSSVGLRRVMHCGGSFLALRSEWNAIISAERR